MTIHSTRAKLPGLAGGLVAGTLVLTAATNGYAAPQVGSNTVKPPEAIVLVRKGDSGSRLFRPPQTIKPPPTPRVRDHRGEQQKFKAPEVFCGRGRPPCSPKGNVRDHRSKGRPWGADRLDMGQNGR